MKKDFCYCNGVRCSIRKWCVRYVDGLKAKKEPGHLWTSARKTVPAISP